MKHKTTMREIRDNFHRIIAIGYCDAQALLHFEDANSYCAGVYGWNCDNYYIDNVAISTGYRPVGAKNSNSNCTLAKNTTIRRRKYALTIASRGKRKKRKLKNCCVILSQKQRERRVKNDLETWSRFARKG